VSCLAFRPVTKDFEPAHGMTPACARSDRMLAQPSVVTPTRFLAVAPADSAISDIKTTNSAPLALLAFACPTNDNK